MNPLIFNLIDDDHVRSVRGFSPADQARTALDVLEAALAEMPLRDPYLPDAHVGMMFGLMIAAARRSVDVHERAERFLAETVPATMTVPVGDALVSARLAEGATLTADGRTVGRLTGLRLIDGALHVDAEVDDPATIEMLRDGTDRRLS